MIPQDLRRNILAHLEDPLNPSTKETLGDAFSLVEHPTQNPKSTGGLSSLGLQLCREDKEIMEAHGKNKEKTRINIQAVIAICQLFSKKASKTITPEGSAALSKGIPFLRKDGQKDFIPTTKKNGNLLTSEFKKMMEEAYKPLKKSCPAAALIIASAAKIQKAAEMAEKEKYEDIAAMA